MLLCFSKRSPVVKKYTKRPCRMVRSWSPEPREKDRHGRRWHDGEEYSRVGDEYRARKVEADAARCWDEEGYRRSRSTQDVYKKPESDGYAARSEKRHSFGTDLEDKHVSPCMVTQALVHKDRLSKSAEAFRYFHSSFGGLIFRQDCTMRFF